MSREAWERIKNMTPEEKAAEAAMREELRKKSKEAIDRALAGEETNLPPWLVENERKAREQYDDKGLPRPSLTERIKDYFKRVESGETEAMKPSIDWDKMFGTGWEERAKSTPQPSPSDVAREEAQDRIDNPHLWAPRPEGLQRVGTGIADWFTGNKFDFDQRGPGKKFLDLITKGGMKNKETGNTVAQDLAEKPPVPPIDPEKVLPPTLRKRVYDRDQIKRVPNELGQLYPDKNEEGFLDPRIQGNGMMTMQYIPELDNPNWTPENPYDGVGQFGSGTLPM